MATEIVMPRLSDSMEEGTILKWLKSPGDEVELGEELVEIETDKANMVYEADAGGTLIEIVAAEGDTLPIGEVIARVGEPGEVPSGDGAAAKPKKQKTSKKPSAAAEESAAASAAPATPRPARSRPSGRRRACEGLPARPAHRARARPRPARASQARGRAGAS